MDLSTNLLTVIMGLARTNIMGIGVSHVKMVTTMYMCIHIKLFTHVHFPLFDQAIYKNITVDAVTQH